MRLRFTPRALENLADIAAYLHERNPTAARRMRASIYQSLQNLVLFPYAGRRQATESIRKIVTLRYPHLVYYIVDEAAGEIVILNVKHSAQKRHHDDA
ncbi:MAG: type II toxin-antitoxin system RelE/ParE family toxin [Methylobacteriaceae bacterium]|nr:type II toxin-antitoxin system RelE/ParE family toxin [Methylobacteriaceae bacterium]MBV9702195.1 type II toxin-antitoxin system RelE/ParE family toxin [Methylobacteriaceae bacterium]